MEDKGKWAGPAQMAGTRGPSLQRLETRRRGGVSGGSGTRASVDARRGGPSRDTEVTPNRKRAKKITVRDAESNRTRRHHEQQRQGRGAAETIGEVVLALGERVQNPG